jgi:hypothetical protein
MHVLEAIRDLHCSPGFRETNFRPFKIKDLTDETSETTSHVLMTKDGFTFPAMGFKRQICRLVASITAVPHVQGRQRIRAGLRRVHIGGVSCPIAYPGL